jgi:predicted amidohydrolase
VATVSLVVLPELVYTNSPESVLSGRNSPVTLAGKTSAPVVFGAVEGTYGEMPFRNVAAVISADGRLLGTFTKQRPVPLMLDGTPGETRPVFETEQGVLGVAICYDFDSPPTAGALAGSGATVLVAPTMDSMDWGRVQHEHHARLFRLRAIETDRWLVRSSSSGRSETISPSGFPSQDGIEIGEVGRVVLPFAHRNSWTLGSRLAFLGPAAAVGTALFLIWRTLLWLQARRRGQVTSAPSLEKKAEGTITPANSQQIDRGPRETIP